MVFLLADLLVFVVQVLPVLVETILFFYIPAALRMALPTLLFSVVVGKVFLDVVLKLLQLLFQLLIRFVNHIFKLLTCGGGDADHRVFGLTSILVEAKECAVKDANKLGALRFSGCDDYKFAHLRRDRCGFSHHRDDHWAFEGRFSHGLHFNDCDRLLDFDCHGLHFDHCDRLFDYLGGGYGLFFHHRVYTRFDLEVFFRKEHALIDNKFLHLLSVDCHDRAENHCGDNDGTNQGPKQS